MRRYFTLLLACLIISCQTTETESAISAAELKRHTETLASDDFEGRGAGYRGEKEAAHYIAEQFQAAELQALGEGTNGEAYFAPFKFYTRGGLSPWELQSTQNVVGVYPGTERADEYIIVGGHHDGQGKKGQIDLGRYIGGVVSDSVAAEKDKIWNSAVDNAVSIAAIMNMAQVLHNNQIETKRSILFVTFSAEESGLDGSVHFANNLPVPKEQVKAMINLEQLVGQDDPEFLYVSFDSNPVFEQLQQKVDSLLTENLSPFYPGIIADTDHYPFYMRGIPSITMGTGSQLNVHTPLDHTEKLDYELLEQRTNYIFNYIVELANTETDLAFVGNTAEHTGVLGCEASTRELEGLDATSAFKITAVVKDSKGHQAGLLPGDLVVAINNQPLTFPEFYREFVELLPENTQEPVVLSVRRGEKIFSSTIK